MSSARPVAPPPIPDSLLYEKAGRDLCARGKAIPIEKDQDGIFVFVAAHPEDEILRDALQLRLGGPVDFLPGDLKTVEEILAKLSGVPREGGNAALLSDLVKSEIALQEGSSLEEIRRKSQAEPVIKLVNNLVNQAIAEQATDIHIEPGENSVKVRYRKDGLLKDSLELPKWVQASLVSRIKILAELDIAEKRLPQDGRIKWPQDSEPVDMRISTLPTRAGEKVVIRILKHLDTVSTLDALGMSPEVLRAIRHIIQRPQGMLFVTGPTGSGKSSTLYAALKTIVREDINISTIEDPIEYRLEGANQVQINEKAGLTFAESLRSLLRQDPDVIMVGEIRDEETAGIAVQAAQTGHLVFSTLHTNDAASAVTRLLDLKVKPFLIGSAVLGVLSQRLVRKLCPLCRGEAVPTDEEKVFLPNLPEMVPAAAGCAQCNGGYRGRTGVFELLPFDAAVREAVLAGKSETEVKRIAGYRTMVEDGLDKIRTGITTPSELIRVAVMEAQT